MNLARFAGLNMSAALAQMLPPFLFDPSSSSDWSCSLLFTFASAFYCYKGLALLLRFSSSPGGSAADYDEDSDSV